MASLLFFVKEMIVVDHEHTCKVLPNFTRLCLTSSFKTCKSKYAVIISVVIETFPALMVQRFVIWCLQLSDLSR